MNARLHPLPCHHRQEVPHIVTDRTRRLRGILVAIVALVFSAGVTLAGGGPAPAADHGLAIASEASGKDVPVRAGGTEETVDEVDEEEAEAPEAEETETTDDGATCTDVEPTNHGTLVCWAAQNAPAGWEGTHGAWVSCVARLSNNGHAVEPAEGEEVEPIVWADMTEESCAEAIEAAKEAKAAERDAAKAERDAEREAAKAERDAAKAERDAAKVEQTANRAGGKQGR
jgi:hypothetical protein